METYNGWTNRDTWLANLWLTGHDEPTYQVSVIVANDDTTNDMTKALRLQRNLKHIGNPDDIDFTQVNWREVIDALKGE